MTPKSINQFNQFTFLVVYGRSGHVAWVSTLAEPEFDAVDRVTFVAQHLFVSSKPLCGFTLFGIDSEAAVAIRHPSPALVVFLLFTPSGVRLYANDLRRGATGQGIWGVRMLLLRMVGIGCFHYFVVCLEKVLFSSIQL